MLANCHEAHYFVKAVQRTKKVFEIFEIIKSKNILYLYGDASLLSYPLKIKLFTVLPQERSKII